MIFIKAENAVDLRHQLITMFPGSKTRPFTEGARSVNFWTNWANNEITIEIPTEHKGMDVNIRYRG